MLEKKLAAVYLFGIIVVFTFMLSYGMSHILFTKYVYYNTYQNQLDNTRIDEIFAFQNKYIWVGFLFIPIWLLIKNFIVSLCLQTGLLIQNFKLNFETTFKIALTAEFVFLLPQIVKLCWFLFIKTDYTLTDVQQFYPLSVLNLFKMENLSSISIYPFQTFNIFEVLYWILLAGGVKQALDIDINKGIKIVFSGYIPALIIWIICIMFITVSLSPTV